KMVVAAQGGRTSGGRGSNGCGTGSSCGSSLDRWKIDDKPVQNDRWDGSLVKNSLGDSTKKGRSYRDGS
uniref:Uncharacterized protein n=1 Tax=Catagonus wagneri TaxID=51154 RepID=A0A8C3VQF2_9CETA